jgi:exopolysaccharide biosynthesis polyprenyl glycosylphosphotransferase
MKEDAVVYSTVSQNKDGIQPTLYVIADTTHTQGFQGKFKRAFDFTCASVAMLLLLPFFTFLAFLVKRSSSGPVFFTQERVGKDGKPFKFYKFRTMIHNSDDAIHRQFASMFISGGIDEDESDDSFKMTDDPRVTGIGSWLRRTSLDELPQVLNILKGEMSFVGPRPPITYEIEQYQPRHHERLRVVPGLTGLWQVSGRSSVSFEEMVRLDIHYINNWSFFEDIKIIFKTIPVVFKGTGGC